MTEAQGAELLAHCVIIRNWLSCCGLMLAVVMASAAVNAAISLIRYLDRG